MPFMNTKPNYGVGKRKATVLVHMPNGKTYTQQKTVGTTAQSGAQARGENEYSGAPLELQSSSGPLGPIDERDVSDWVARLDANTEGDITEELLADLSTSEHARLRHAVASHSLASSSLIDELSYDEDHLVLLGVAGSLNIGEDTQNRIFDAPLHGSIRDKLLINPSLAPALRARATDGSNNFNLYEVCRRDDVTAAEISLAANIHDEAACASYLLQAAASSPLLNDADAMNLTKSATFDVQMLLACNPVVSDAVGTVLLDAERTDVQVGAEENLNIRLNPPTTVDEAIALSAEARGENLRAKFRPQWRDEAVMFESRRRIYNGWAAKLSAGVAS